MNYYKNCEYQLNKLKNKLYLYNFDNTKIDYAFDNNDQDTGIVRSIEGDAVALNVNNVEYTEDISSDSRFLFLNKLTIQVNKDFKKIIDYFLNNRLLIIFENTNGEKFILNPEFPITINYSLNVSKESNLELTLINHSNIPTLLLDNTINVTSELNEKCEYTLNKPVSLQLGEIHNVFIKEGNIFNVTTKGDNAIIDIEYNKDSLQFNEQYDGDTFKQTLTFQLPFEKYMYFFHLDLIKYIQNRFYSFIKMNNNEYIIGGYRQGMFPEFNISNNVITFTLSSIYHYNSLIMGHKFEVIPLPNINYYNVEGECVDGEYCYTLKRKYINNTPTNDYVCLTGFESKYTNYNIVEIYEKTSTRYGIIVNNNINCDDKCKIVGLPDYVIFTSQMSKSFTVESSCKLEFIYQVTNCNVVYTPDTNTLSITNKRDSGNYTIIVKLSDGTMRNISVTVVSAVTPIIKRVINATAQAQIITLPTLQNINNVKTVETTLDYTIGQNNKSYLVQLPENTSTILAIKHPFKITYNDGSVEEFQIKQDKLYEKIINDGTTHCFGEDLWEMWLKKVGYTPDKIDIGQGYIKGQIIERNSLKCLPRLIARQTGEICVEGKLYWIVDYMNPETSEVVKTNLSYVSTGCEGSTTQTKWVLNKDYSVCQNGVSYYVENQYASIDGINWYLVPDTQRVSNMPSNKNVCDVIRPNSERLYKWENTSDSYCLIDAGEETMYNCEDSRRVEGEYICEGKNKYAKYADYIAPTCGERLFYGYSKGALIEENSTDCGYIVPEAIYQWVEEGFICTGFDKYAQEKEQKSIDNGVSWQDTGRTRKGKLLEENSADCGYVRANTLSFEFSKNKPQVYTINDVEYTASTSPVNVDIKKDLYVQDFISAHLMFWQKNENNITKIINIPDTDKIIDMNAMFLSCENLTSINLNNFKTSNVRDMSRMFERCKIITKLDLSSFNTSNVIDMSDMFNNCRKLTSLDLSNFNTSNVTNMRQMFLWCDGLQNIDLSSFDTANVRDMYGMFWDCKKLTSLDLSSFDTSKVTDMNNMFANCRKLTSLDLSNFNTSNVISMASMFLWCDALTNIDLSSFDTSKVIRMDDMFNACYILKNLNISSWDLSNVTNMSQMFYDCTALKTIYMRGCNQTTIDKIKNQLAEDNITGVTIITQ